MPSSRPFRVVIAGLGSAGRRHLRNLRAVNDRAEITLLRSFRSTLPDDELRGLPVDTTIQEALARRPDAVIVATPTALHLDTALPAARAGCHLLIEKPVSHSLNGVEELRSTAASVLVGFQYRFHPGLRRIRHLLHSVLAGQPWHASLEWGEYLPGWHPWEDYRHSYAARAELGGGVLLTLCHPFDYLRWLFGEVESVAATTSSQGGLGIDVEDTADIQLRFAGGASAQVHLDYLAQPPRHRLHLTGPAGALEWDLSADGERDAMFLEEMRHFVACLEGREQPVCTLDDGIAALRIALAAKQSAAQGVPLAP